MTANNSSNLTNNIANTPSFNPAIYAQLLADTLPKVIKSEEDYGRLVSIFDELWKKADNQTLSIEEATLFDLLTILIEVYEQGNFQLKAAQPHDIIQHLLEA